jgi:O-antigen/teichoic acid export membrane protein
MYRNATLLLTSSVIRYGGQLGVFILLARFFGAAQAGIFAFAVAVTAPVFILASLGMRDIYLTLRTRVALTHYERLRAATVLAAIVVSVVISLLFPTNTAIVVAIVAAAKALDSFRDLYGAALQKASRLRVSVTTSIIVAILQIGTLATAIALGASMPVALSISTLAYMFVVVFVMRPITLRVSLDDQPVGTHGTAKRPWIELTRVGFPTGISYGLLTLLSTLPQYFLSWSWGPVEVGKYATLLYLVVAMEMALNALAQSWIPVGRALEREGALSPRRVLGVALRWTLITLPFALVGIAIAMVAFPRIFGPAYAITVPEVFPLGVAMALSPAVFAATTWLAIQNRYNWALIISTLTVSFAFVAGWVLIKPFGITGALWAFAACLAVRAGASLAFTKHGADQSRARTAELVAL